MVCNLRSTVDGAIGLFYVQAAEPERRRPVWLGFYFFHNNRFYLQKWAIAHEFPLSNIFRMVVPSATRNPNLQYGYTVSVSLSGALAPISHFGLGSETQKTTWVAFGFIYRAFLKRGRFLWLGTKKRAAFAKLFLPNWWFGERSYGGDL